MLRKLLVIALLLAPAVPAVAHAQGSYPIENEEVRRSGPRYGVIWLSPQIADSVTAHNKNQKINPTTSLFGWEFQRELLRNPKGIVPVSSLVLGLAGLDQGLVLPSATWVVGMRTPEDIEFGIGPNVSPAGAALAVSAGMTFHSGQLNIPFDLTYVSSKLGTRFSLTTGFNVMK